MNDILETIYNLVFNDKFTAKMKERKRLNALRQRMSSDKNSWIHILTKSNSLETRQKFMKSQAGGSGSVSNVLQTIISILPTMLLALI